MKMDVKEMEFEDADQIHMPQWLFLVKKLVNTLVP
jgi:hypothetical protein